MWPLISLHLFLCSPQLSPTNVPRLSMISQLDDFPACHIWWHRRVYPLVFHQYSINIPIYIYIYDVSPWQHHWVPQHHHLKKTTTTRFRGDFWITSRDRPGRLHVQGSRGAIRVGDFDLKGFHQQLPLVAHDAAGQGSLATVLQCCLGCDKITRSLKLLAS